MYSNIILEVRNGVAHLTLNRPEAANGINKEMADELDQAARKCDDDPVVRAILISGAGKMFCAGGDFAQMTTGADGPARSIDPPHTTANTVGSAPAMIAEGSNHDDHPSTRHISAHGVGARGCGD